MKIFHSDILSFPLHPNQDFLVAKYELLIRRILSAGFARPRELLTPPEATLEEITRVHDPDYVERLLKGQLSPRELREVGLPWSPGIIERARRSTGATIEACRWALREGVALHLGGGTHHAFRNRAKGFCWLNDCAIAARAMIAEQRVRRVLILDCDVHQGDGTAAIFRGDPDVFTFSIHGSSSYPYHRKPGDLDIDLPSDTGDQAYLQALEAGLKTALERFTPELVIYLAGADIYEGDRYGSLSLSLDGIGLRDRLVFDCFARSETPLAVTLAGGYSAQIEDAVEIHFQTARIAFEYHQRRNVRISE
ncbi:histone deacetylase [Desulfuromonas versatilis]|uniref:Histone deacetylase n=1 Tax=Desulfuromonas versatilis TaxID=2802975 RepID=A0ABN6DW05_9BACT|nr:histone deacetylase [Desulfuromonas versatilis]BCR04245.1 histone deacetylase [Desulfuromonas versatilis]